MKALLTTPFPKATEQNNTIAEVGKRLVVFPYAEFRKGQRDSIKTISDFIGQRGKQVLFFRGSTGIGKTPTGMAAGLSTIFDTQKPKECRIFYVSTTKNLQEQARKIAESFAEANPDLNITVNQLRGRRNYPCLKEAGKTANDCVSTRSSPCNYKPKNADCIPGGGRYAVCKNGTIKVAQGEMCEYYGRKFEIIPRKQGVEIVVMTTQYLITEALFAEEINPADFIIFDEGRHLESQLVNATALEIDEGTLNYIFGYEYPINCKTDNYHEVKIFLSELASMLGKRGEELEAEFKMVSNKKQTFAVMRKKEVVARIVETIRYLERNWDEDNIVIDKYMMYKFKRESNCLRLRFVDIAKPFSKLFNEIITNDGAMCLMSATMQSEESLVKTFNLKCPTLYFNVDSGWDRSLRPVVLMKGLRLNAKNFDTTRYTVFEIIEKAVKTCADYNKNLLVHTHNNKLRNFLVDAFMNDDRIISHDLPDMGHSQNAHEAFEMFCSSRGKTLISASMGEGLDFKDDICTLQIIVKIPYPNMIDVWVKRKSQLDKDFMGQEAVLALEQMIGRIHRHDKDFGLTIILDSAFMFLTMRTDTVKLDSESWDNLIGFRKEQRIEAADIDTLIFDLCDKGPSAIQNMNVVNARVKAVGGKTSVVGKNLLNQFSKYK